MQARRRDFADGPKPGEAGSPARVGGDPAHVIVLGRRDGDEFGRWVDAGFSAMAPDSRKFLLEIRTYRLAAIEVDAAAGVEFGVDGACHDITGRKFAARIDCRHEAFAIRIDERRPFAAQCFGCERRGIDPGIDGGRMKLHEFGVGDHRTGASRHRQGFALRVRRIGGEREQRADAARRQHDGRSRNERVAAIAGCGRTDQPHAFDAAILGNEVVGFVAFEKRGSTASHVRRR